jgi:hypothetical protein
MALHMFSLPMEKKLTALLVSRIDGEMKWLNTLLCLQWNSFNQYFPGLFLIPLLLVYVQKASHSVLSDWQP